MPYAPVAQLDRVPGYEPGGQRFESSPVQHLYKEKSMILEVFPLGPLQTNAVLIACPATKLAAIIDAPFESSELLIQRACDSPS